MSSGKSAGHHIKNNVDRTTGRVHSVGSEDEPWTTGQDTLLITTGQLQKCLDSSGDLQPVKDMVLTLLPYMESAITNQLQSIKGSTKQWWENQTTPDSEYIFEIIWGRPCTFLQKHAAPLNPFRAVNWLLLICYLGWTCGHQLRFQKGREWLLYSLLP